MNQIENIACGATEPIETQDDEFVIGAQELHDRLKLRASSARCARACFGEEDFTARCLQPGNLDVELLVDGDDAGVADVIGRALGRERVCQYVLRRGVAGTLKKNIKRTR